MRLFKLPIFFFLKINSIFLFLVLITEFPVDLIEDKGFIFKATVFSNILKFLYKL